MNTTSTIPPTWWSAVLGVVAVVTLTNGVLMMLFSAPWYECIINPARASLFNRHFVIDVGGTYFTLGAGMLWTVWRPHFAGPVLGMSLLFHVLHALNHVAEYMAGDLPSRHWTIEVFAIFAPLLLLVVLLRMAPRLGDRS